MGAWRRKSPARSRVTALSVVRAENWHVEGVQIIMSVQTILYSLRVGRVSAQFKSTGPRWSEIPDFQPIFARSASTVTPSEKSAINTNRKSITRFPMSLIWSSYVAPESPKEGGSKMEKGRFPSKIALRLKKICYNVSLCENCQRQSCKAFIGLTFRAKMIGGERPLLPKISTALEFWPRCSKIADSRSLFARSDSAVTPSI